MFDIINKEDNMKRNTHFPTITFMPLSFTSEDKFVPPGLRNILYFSYFRRNALELLGRVLDEHRYQIDNITKSLKSCQGAQE